jgi:hypothetical protein
MHWLQWPSFHCISDPRNRPQASELQNHPYLSLPPDWQFDPVTLGERNVRLKLRVSGKQSRRPWSKNAHSQTTVAAPPQNNRRGHAHTVSASANEGPQPVVIIPIQPPEPGVPPNDNKSDTSTGSKEDVNRTRRRKGRFFVANPDGDAEARTYVYHPPPLPEMPNPPTYPYHDQQRVMRHAYSQPNFLDNHSTSFGADATSTSYYSASESGNEDDSNSSLWQKAPADINKNKRQAQKRKSRIESKRQSAWGRPNVNDVYNNIGDFFHDYDIDKPIPKNDETAYMEALDHVKSTKTLREVADERRRSNATFIQRRRTKLWGTRTEQVSAEDSVAVIL